MYITKMTHFLDETGNIPQEMQKEARELASFMALVVDTTTINRPTTLALTNIRCFEKGCHGMIKTSLRPSNEEIYWYCPDCENEGTISEWQGTRWDNRNG